MTLLTPDNPALRNLHAGDLLWVVEMEMGGAVQVGLVLAGLPEKSTTPQADFETILEMHPRMMKPYQDLLQVQWFDRGQSEVNEANGMLVYTLAHPVEDMTQVMLRPPRIRDLLMPDGMTQGPAFDMLVLARLSGVSIDTYKSLRLGDFLALQDALPPFLAGDFG